MNRTKVKMALAKHPHLLRLFRIPFIVLPRIYCRYSPFKIGKLHLWDAVITHTWWMESQVIARTKFGDILHIDPTEIVGKYIYYFGIWEPCLSSWLLERLKPGDVFIDIGANIGYFSLLASRIVGPYGQVVAVEALPDIAQILSHNIKLNGAANVRFVNVAAWDKDDLLMFFTDSHLSAKSTCLESHADKWELKHKCEVKAQPLSGILTQPEIQSARFVKIDVEGAEIEVISGMQRIMPLFNNDVEFIIEVNLNSLNSHSVAENYFLKWFADWGFHAYEMSNDYDIESCISKNIHPRPRRLDKLEWVNRTEMDIVFSKIDADYL
jgi:FkbM family methyltransferase